MSFCTCTICLTKKKTPKKKNFRERNEKTKTIHKTLIHKRKKMSKFTCSKLTRCLIDIINGNTCI